MSEDPVTPGMLSLMSAKLALKELGELGAGAGPYTADLLFDVVSSSEDGQLSAGSLSPTEEMVPLQGAAKGLTLSSKLKSSSKQQSSSLVHQSQTSKTPLAPFQVQPAGKSSGKSPSKSSSKLYPKSPGSVSKEQSSLPGVGKTSVHSDSSNKSQRHYGHHASKRKAIESSSKAPLQPLPADKVPPGSEEPVVQGSGSQSAEQEGFMPSEQAVDPGLHSGAESAKSEANSVSSEGGSAPSEQIHMKRGRIASASLRDLLSQFGVSSEEEIARTMGVEQLTRLGRATSARVVVDTLDLDPAAVDKILAHTHRPLPGKAETSPALR